MISNAHLNFGYPWWISYGHLPIVAVAGLLLLIGYMRKWSTWLMLILGVLFLWSSAAFVVARFVFDINGRASLPTQNFFRSGMGQVLDIGAGTGRSSIMVLEARPRATVVALDLFGKSFEQHFGPGDSPEQRLLRNLQAAGVDQRVTIKSGDMRDLPFQPASFDAIVSAYTIDHVNRQGIQKSLAEAARVIKPGGDFLLILIGKEPWGKFAFGPLLMHAGTRGSFWWSGQLEQSGFQVLEQGTRPGTFYLLCRRVAIVPN